METDSQSEPQDSGISLDFDGDGVPDLVIKKTNGHSAYVNAKWLIGVLVAGLTTVLGIVGVVL